MAIVDARSLVDAAERDLGLYHLTVRRINGQHPFFMERKEKTYIQTEESSVANIRGHQFIDQKNT